MQNVKKQKNNLEKRYESILATPKNKIDFNFFLAINFWGLVLPFEFLKIIHKEDKVNQNAQSILTKVTSA